MLDLENILNRHRVPRRDRATFYALVNRGTRPNSAFRQKLRGPYAPALAEVLHTLSSSLPFVFPCH